VAKANPDGHTILIATLPELMQYEVDPVVKTKVIVF